MNRPTQFSRWRGRCCAVLLIAVGLLGYHGSVEQRKSLESALRQKGASFRSRSYLPRFISTYVDSGLLARPVSMTFPAAVDHDLAVVSSLKSLESVDFSDSVISDDGLRSLQLPQLRMLQIWNTCVTDKGVEAIAAIPTIRELKLGSTGITDAGVRHLTRIKNLQWIELSETAITDKSAERIGRITTLTGLWLSQTMITDNGVRHLVNLPKLRDLSLRGTNISDESLLLLETVTTLRTVVIYDCDVTPAAVVRLREALPQTRIYSD